MSPVRLFLALALALLVGACHWFAPVKATRQAAAPAGEALVPSPRLMVGRVIAIDAQQRFAFVELASDAPATALAEGTELIARTPELRTTARLRVSRYLRGRTLGTTIVDGQPAPGDEVVWLAP